jgi:hypothetical protein
MFSTNAIISSASFMAPSLPGTTGTPAAIAAVLAVVLSLKTFKFSTVGPTNVMPAAPHFSAKAGLSLKNPYPG